jgi:integrase
VYCELFLPTLAPKTRTEYSAAVRRALADLPDMVTHAALLRWHRVTLARYVPSYRNFFLHVLRTVSRKAAYVSGDAELAALFWQIQPVREPELPPRCPPRDTLAKALELCCSPAERLIVRLAGLAGLRRGEILGLRPEDYEPVTAMLRIVRQRKRGERKNHRSHSVRIDDPIMRDELEWTIANRSALRSRRGWFRGGSEGFLIPWSLRRLNGLLSRLRGGLGPTYLPHRHGWHAFRHWGATELARAGKSVWEICHWLGDADPGMATRYVALFRGEAASVSELAKAVKL